MAEEKEEQKEQEKRKEVYVDFEGKAPETTPKILIQEDSYKGVIKAVELIRVPAYEQPKGAKEVLMEDKVLFSIQLSGEGSDDALLQMYANPVIKKSSGTKGYSNSKLFDLLDAAGEIEAAKAQCEELETLEGLVVFLSTVLVDRKCKALVKTRNKGTDNPYSSIGSIVRFEAKDEEK